MQAPQRRLSPTWSIRLRVCQIARSNIGRRRINALRLDIVNSTEARTHPMKTFALRLNPDTRKGRPYSAYPTLKQYKAIHESSPMDGFHEAMNFLAEQGVVRGYLPPKHSSSLRSGEPFALVTISAKTAKVGGDRLVGFQVGCIYEGERARRSVPRASRELGLLWHFSCPASLSRLLAEPLPHAREIVVGEPSGWRHGPTVAVSRTRFVKALDHARQSAASVAERESIDRLRSTLLEGILTPEVGTVDGEDFEDAVAEAYRHPNKTPLGNISPVQVRTTTYQFVRDPAVVAHALRVAKGICQNCERPAPFFSRRTGLPYLEVHHKQTLADGGTDTINNVIALCPNCHRKCHFASNDT